MYSFIKGKLPKGINGKVAVILNDRDTTVVYKNDKGQPFKGGQFGKKDKLVVRDFPYLTLKKEGSKMDPEKKVMKQLYSWIKNNIPKTSKTKEIWS